MPDEDLPLSISEIRDTLQDCNINFLIGSGASSPYLKTLGNVETLLTDLDKSESATEDQKKIVRAAIYKEFFDCVIAQNTAILDGDADSLAVLENYKNFLTLLNVMLLKRKSTILSKQVNIFTTNIDVFLEKAFEETCLEYNDGFSGRFDPQFSLSNFKKSQFQKSLHYDNTSEIPVFNLLKLHGSLTWRIENENQNIKFLHKLDHIEKIKALQISDDCSLTVSSDKSLEDLISDVIDRTSDSTVSQFLQAYEELAIVNPTKEKFKHTVLNQTYYDLLRVYSNELEKENTVLFVVGFSFADEHIKAMTLRAANSNPTLMIYVFAHSSNAKTYIQDQIPHQNIKNKNIRVISPDQKEISEGEFEDAFRYNLQTVNERVFGKLLNKDTSEDQPEDGNEAVQNEQ